MLIGCLRAGALGQSDPTESDDIISRYVASASKLRCGIASVSQTSEEIRRGHFDLSKRMLVPLPEPLTNTVSHRVIFAFDVSSGTFLFSRMPLVDRPRLNRGKLLTMEDRIICWNSSDFAYIRPRDSEYGVILSPFDFRSCGINSLRSVADAESWDDEVASLRKLKNLKVSRIDSVWRLSSQQSPLTTNPDTLQTTVLFEIDFDLNMGFMPIRSSTSWLPTTQIDKRPMTVQDVTHVEWTQKGEAFVPVKVNFRKGRENVVSTTQTFTLNWEHVNEPEKVAPLLTLEGMGIPESVDLVDARGDEWITVNREAKVEPPAAIVETSGIRTWVLVSLSGVLLFFSGAVGWLLQSRHASPLQS